MTRKSPDLTPRDTAQRWAAFFIEQKFNAMWKFRNEIPSNPNEDNIHDMRVASRRLRSVLMDFRDILPKKTFRPLLQLTKTLTQKLGLIRDADILLERLQSIPKEKPNVKDITIQALVGHVLRQKEDDLKILKLYFDELDMKHYEKRFLQMIRELQNG